MIVGEASPKVHGTKVELFHKTISPPHRDSTMVRMPCVSSGCKPLVYLLKFFRADVAQLVEQPIRNRQVTSSSLVVGSSLTPACALVY
jgi:hypothetical protein